MYFDTNNITNETNVDDQTEQKVFSLSHVIFYHFMKRVWQRSNNTGHKATAIYYEIYTFVF